MLLSSAVATFHADCTARARECCVRECLRALASCLRAGTFDSSAPRRERFIQWRQAAACYDDGALVRVASRV